MSNDDTRRRPSEAEFATAAAIGRINLYKRSLPVKETAPALSDLHKRLAGAGQLYERGELADQRYAVVDAISGVYDFLLDQGFSPMALEPLFRPIEALEGQHENRLDPLFAERRRAGRPGKSGDNHTRVGTLAALANFWIEQHGDSGELKRDLATAATRLRGRWFGTITAAQLTGARVALAQEGSDHPIVQTAAKVRAFLDRAASDFGQQHAFAVVVRQLNDGPRSSAIGNSNVLEQAPAEPGE
ncbi:hypothetical protein [Sphingomonas endolithica]|uniref:hypothetical protein n=1 Tax=Sphingomonas endolithica TaxID=2972485 RepID=UPI0021AE387B|nr:hypothetical protein [Sphingomonas sp. ZFBP2030]